MQKSGKEPPTNDEAALTIQKGETQAAEPVVVDGEDSAEQTELEDEA